MYLIKRPLWWDLIVIMALILGLGGIAYAQQKPVDPLIEEVSRSLSPEGIRERQLLAIKALADAYEAQKAVLAAERKYWMEYVK